METAEWRARYDVPKPKLKRRFDETVESCVDIHDRH
jgi:hypothetical protein